MKYLIWSLISLLDTFYPKINPPPKLSEKAKTFFWCFAQTYQTGNTFSSEGVEGWGEWFFKKIYTPDGCSWAPECRIQCLAVTQKTKVSMWTSPICDSLISGSHEKPILHNLSGGFASYIESLLSVRSFVQREIS